MHSPLLNYISLVPSCLKIYIFCEIHFAATYVSCRCCFFSSVLSKFDAVQRYNKTKPISITKCLLNTHNIIVQFCSEIIQINTQLSRANISTCQQHIYLLTCLAVSQGIKTMITKKREAKMYVEKYIQRWT